MKKKVIVIILMVLSLVLCVSLTYSFFNSSVGGNSINQNVAKFIFNADSMENIELSLNDLKPGDIKNYSFLVSNNEKENISGVSLEYQIILHTYHFLPLEIKLYSIKNNVEELILTCDEKNHQRNDYNELICSTSIKEMDHINELQDEYKLKIEFPIEYNHNVYSSLVDFINIEIKSWQKIGD